MDVTPYSVLKGGIAIGSKKHAPYNGTAGMIVNYQDKRMVLSCYHVLVPDYQFRPGNEIGQPSTGKRVALLHKAIINSTIDAALAVIDESVNSRNEIHELGIQPKRFAEKSDIMRIYNEDLIVCKRGIASKITYGKIVATRIPASITFPSSDYRHRLYDQLMIQNRDNKPFSQEADSGACVINYDGTVIGLIVGNTPTDYRNSYVTPIYNLLDHFEGISI